MHTHLITTNQFFKYTTFPSVVGIYHTLFSFFFVFCAFCLELAPVPEKAPLLLRPPALLSLETAHEIERERERENVRKRGWGRKKPKKRDRFGDGKG